jgi:hypothetical protein
VAQPAFAAAAVVIIATDARIARRAALGITAVVYRVKRCLLRDNLRVVVMASCA